MFLLVGGLGIDGISTISTYQPDRLSFRVTAEGNLVIVSDISRDNDVTLSVYSTSGAKMFTTRVRGGSGDAEINLSHLPHGLYVVQIDSSDPRLKGSTIIRR